jgi:hypothetical protein
VLLAPLLFSLLLLVSLLLLLGSPDRLVDVLSLPFELLQTPALYRRVS